VTATYEETLDWLYHLEAKRGMDFRLARLDPVLDRLGHPERAFTCVHIAGTNGKGSTAAMIEAALRAGGHRTGLYTSPHLVSFRERIRMAGVPASRREVVASISAVRTAMEAARQELTFFEIVTLAALHAMRERGVAVAVIEAGLGGRLDATNVAYGQVCAITSVDIDHAEYLGDTIASIAFEKAGIVKPGSVLVTGALPCEAEKVVAARVEETSARWLAYGRDFGDFAPMVQAQLDGTARLPGTHQRRNAAVAATVVEQLGERFPVEPSQRDRAIVEARWPGRLELIEGAPVVVLDAAHNPESASALAAALEETRIARPRTLVFAAMADKDWRAMLAALRPCFDDAVFVPLSMARAEAPRRFLEAWPQARVAASPEEGLALARQLSAGHGSVVIAGSIFLLGHLYRSAGGSLLEQDLSD